MCYYPDLLDTLFGRRPIFTEAELPREDEISYTDGDVVEEGHCIGDMADDEVCGRFLPKDRGNSFRREFF